MERSSETSPSRGARAFGQVAAMGSGVENGYEYEAPGVAVDAGELQKAREWLQPRFCGHPPEARGNYFGEVGRAGRAVCNRLGCHVTLEEVAMAYKAHRRRHGKKVKQERDELEEQRQCKVRAAGAF